MKSYKGVVHSYKNIDKDIVMNAPEGAMWVHSGDTGLYYKITPQGRFLVYDMEYSNDWDASVNTFEKIFNNLIPLPNIEIPWEATEDSVCPVAEDTIVVVKWLNRVHTSRPQFASDFYWDNGDRIVSYKIIDEEYLPKIEKDMYKTTLDKYLGSECVIESVLSKPDNPSQQLIKTLEFLQILANKFPEIKDKVVELMEVELDAWWEGESSGE